jgi:hypothetical protein
VATKAPLERRNHAHRNDHRREQHDLQRKLPKANAAAHVANAVQINAGADQLNRRYAAQLHRQFVRNIKLLREPQADRLNGEPTLDTLYPEDPPATPSPAAQRHHRAPARP